MCSRLVTSRLRQLPASPSDPVQHASFLQVGVLLTSRAVLWRLTTGRVFDRAQRQSEDVVSHQITVASKQQYPCARTDARRYWQEVDLTRLLQRCKKGGRVR